MSSFSHSGLESYRKTTIEKTAFELEPPTSWGLSPAYHKTNQTPPECPNIPEEDFKTEPVVGDKVRFKEHSPEKYNFPVHIVQRANPLEPSEKRWFDTDFEVNENKPIECTNSENICAILDHHFGQSFCEENSLAKETTHHCDFEDSLCESENSLAVRIHHYFFGHSVCEESENSLAEEKIQGQYRPIARTPFVHTLPIHGIDSEELEVKHKTWSDCICDIDLHRSAIEHPPVTYIILVVGSYSERIDTSWEHFLIGLNKEHCNTKKVYISKSAFLAKNRAAEKEKKKQIRRKRRTLVNPHLRYLQNLNSPTIELGICQTLALLLLLLLLFSSVHVSEPGKNSVPHTLPICTY